jgi:hypothetical protein
MVFELVSESPDNDPELMDSVNLEDELRLCGFVDDPEQQLWWLPHPFKDNDAVAVIKYERLHSDSQERLLTAARSAATRLELIHRNEGVKDREAESKKIERKVVGR